MKTLFGGIYDGRKVLITGHTGFKGSWLTLWLKSMGADVIGYSLEAPTEPNHFGLLDIDMISIIGDIRDQEKLNGVFQEYRPEIVFHLAAQPLVRLSYDEPVNTFSTNVMGTLNIFEVCRKTDSVRAIVNITSDKAYENKEWIWGYRENDPMGGYDPYSASKGCAELVTSSYRNSYFNLNDYRTKHNVLLASCRAGNVIGGGDWAEDRLMTDIIKAASQGKKVKIRNPHATRPWQHVLEPLSGYLTIGQKLLEGRKEFAEAWNFGPNEEGSISVGNVIINIQKHWDKVVYEFNESDEHPHEANLLKLDCSKAYFKLRWKNVWNSDKTFAQTAAWYKSFYEQKKVYSLSDLAAYVQDAKKRQIEWTI